jgi:hypothetical protein
MKGTKQGRSRGSVQWSTPANCTQLHLNISSPPKNN